MQRDTGSGRPSTLQEVDSSSFLPQRDLGPASRSLGWPNDPTQGYVPRPSKYTGLSCLWLFPRIMRINTGLHARVQLAGLFSNTLRPEANRRALRAPTHFCKFPGNLRVGSPSSSGLLGESAARLVGRCPVLGLPAYAPCCDRLPRCAGGSWPGGRCQQVSPRAQNRGRGMCVASPSSCSSSLVFLI